MKKGNNLMTNIDKLYDYLDKNDITEEFIVSDIKEAIALEYGVKKSSISSVVSSESKKEGSNIVRVGRRDIENNANYRGFCYVYKYIKRDIDECKMYTEAEELQSENKNKGDKKATVIINACGVGKYENINFIKENLYLPRVALVEKLNNLGYRTSTGLLWNYLSISAYIRYYDINNETSYNFPDTKKELRSYIKENKLGIKIDQGDDVEIIQEKILKNNMRRGKAKVVSGKEYRTYNEKVLNFIKNNINETDYFIASKLNELRIRTPNGLHWNNQGVQNFRRKYILRKGLLNKRDSKYLDDSYEEKISTSTNLSKSKSNINDNGFPIYVLNGTVGIKFIVNTNSIGLKELKKLEENIFREETEIFLGEMDNFENKELLQGKEVTFASITDMIEVM